MNRRMERADNFLPRVDAGAHPPNAVDRTVVSLTAPASQAAEQYRALYYRLDRLRETRPMKMVAFTSAVMGEGKTVTSVNVALTAARATFDRRILLLDADLRRSQVGEMLGFRGRPGLSELLAGECNLPAALRRFRATRLAVLPAGGPSEDPTGLLAGAKMRELLTALEGAFDEIYIDLPPTLPFADAPILANRADGVVMVIRARVTSSEHVESALEQLASAHVVGCILNDAEPATLPYGKRYSK